LDALVKKVRRGVTVRQLVPGQDTYASQITIKDLVNYNLDAAYVEISQNQWELENGDIGTVDGIRTEMINKLTDFYVVKLFSLLGSLYASASDTAPTGECDCYDTYTGDITAAALEDMIDEISDKAGGVKAVVGRRNLLAPITKFAGYRVSAELGSGTGYFIVPIPSTLETIQSTGWFGKYYGANFIALDQIYDNAYDRNKLITDDKIFVIGNKCGEFITYGDVKEDEWNEMSTAPPTWHLRIYQQFGMIIDKMENVGVLYRSGA